MSSQLLFSVTSRLATVLLLLATGCQDPVTAAHGPLTVTASSGRLLVANHAVNPVSVFAVEQDAQAYTDFVLCTTPGLGCIIVPPQGTQTLILDEVSGYETGRVVAVHYLELAPGTTPQVRTGAAGVVVIRP